MARKSLIALVLHGAEERNLEYKASMNWNDIRTRSKVARTAMSMANIRDGGVMVFGVEEDASGNYRPAGMKEEDAASFNLDDVMDSVNRYADPYVDMDLDRVHWEGRVFVVIQIKEFEEIPVVCRKSGVDLKRGAIYTRSRRKNESVPISSQTEMREVLEMSFDKRMRRYRNQFYKWGLIQLVSEEKLEEERFDQELDGDWAAYPAGVSVTGKQSWAFLIRPTGYRPDRIATPAELASIVEGASVGLRGNPFPALPAGGPRKKETFVEARSGERGRRWWWRFYRSGQFIVFRGLPDQDREAGLVDVLDALAVLTELFEFASRLVQKDVFDTRIAIRGRIAGIRGSRLYYLKPDAPEFAGFVSEGDQYGFETVLRPEELIARGHEEALARTVQLLQRFSWEHPPRALLAEEQRKFLERRMR